MNRRLALTWMLQLALMALLAAPPARAVDGVIEINQAAVLAGGVTPGDTPDFPVTISAPGSYRLTANLTVTDPAKDGIHATADGVSIDLNGFEIAGPVVCTGLGSAVSCGAGLGRGIRANEVAGTTIRQGVVRGFGGDGVTLGERATVNRLSVESNGGTGIAVGARSIVSDVKAFRNKLSGIGTGAGSVIERSAASSNGVLGLLAGDGNSVALCVAYHNGFDGIGVGSGSVIADSSAYLNERDGIFIGSGGLVRGNSASQNGGDGIQSAGGGATVVNNTANGNTGWGFIGTLSITDALGSNNFVGNGSGGAINAIAIGCNTTNGVNFCPPHTP